jgi:hypothetical protein
MTEEMKYGYWRYFSDQLELSGEKRIIRKVEDYKGEKSFILAPTQLDGCTQAEQAKNVKKWCELLENEQLNLDKLWITTRISQKILDAVCCQQSLNGLFVKWGVYESVSNLGKLTNLEYLHLGGGASLKNIDLIFQLEKLKAFDSIRLYEIHDYSALANLKNLVALSIEGDGFGTMQRVNIKSLDFLEKLPQLEWLHLIMTRIDDHSYLPILKLPNLKFLSYPKDKDLDKDIDMFKKWL